MPPEWIDRETIGTLHRYLERLNDGSLAAPGGPWGTATRIPHGTFVAFDVGQAERLLRHVAEDGGTPPEWIGQGTIGTLRKILNAAECWPNLARSDPPPPYYYVLFDADHVEKFLRHVAEHSAESGIEPEGTAMRAVELVDATPKPDVEAIIGDLQRVIDKLKAGQRVAAMPFRVDFDEDAGPIVARYAVRSLARALGYPAESGSVPTDDAIDDLIRRLDGIGEAESLVRTPAQRRIKMQTVVREWFKELGV